MSEDTKKGLKFTIRDGGAKPSEAQSEEQPEEDKEKQEELDHAVTNTKSGYRRKS